MTQTQYKVSDLTSLLEGKIHDQSLQKINGDILEKVDEAARNVLLNFDLKETKQYALLEPVVAGKKVYTCPDGLKGNSIITIQRSTDDENYFTKKLFLTNVESVQQVYPDRYSIAIDYSSGTKTIVFNDPGATEDNVTYIIGFYSINIFKTLVDTEYVLVDKPVSLDDIVLLEKDSINVLAYELAELIAQELQGEDSSFDLKYWQIKKKNVWDMYGRRYPSEAKPKQVRYYRPFKR